MTTSVALQPTRPGAETDPPRMRAGAPPARRSVRLRPFRTPVRGHAFASAPPPGTTALEAGLRARLTREPANPADALAVAVWVEEDDRPWRIGYLDRGVAARVAPRLDDGLHVDARVEGWVAEPQGRWHRPLLRLVPDDAVAAATRREQDGPAAGLPGEQDGPARKPGEQEPSLWGRPPGAVRRIVRRA